MDGMLLWCPLDFCTVIAVCDQRWSHLTCPVLLKCQLMLCCSVWSTVTKHHKRRSIHHQWSVGGTWCLAVADHAQTERTLSMWWHGARQPVDLNSCTLHCGWLVRQWNSHFGWKLVCAIVAYKKLSYGRETERCFVSLNFMLSHSRFKVIWNDTLEKCVSPY